MTTTHLDARDRAALEVLERAARPLTSSAILSLMGATTSHPARDRLAKRLVRMSEHGYVEAGQDEFGRVWRFVTGPDPTLCGRRAKWGYPNREAAEESMAAIRRKMIGKRGKKPQRAYQCPWCGRWHLTSKEHSREELAA